MKKSVVSSSRVKWPHQAHSLATRGGPFLFMSGQLALDAETGNPIRDYTDLRGDLPYPALGQMASDSWEAPTLAQASTIYDQMGTLLEEQGAPPDNLLFYCIYLKEFRYFPLIARHRAKRFAPKLAPPSTGAQVPAFALSESVALFDPIGAVPDNDGGSSKIEALTAKALDNTPLSNYQLGARLGPYLFFAGVVGAVPETGKIIYSDRDLEDVDWPKLEGSHALHGIEGPVSAQAWFILNLYEKVLGGMGSGLENILKMNIYICNMRDLPAVERIFRKVMPSSMPPVTIIGVESLAIAPHFRIEIEVVALAPDGGTKREILERVEGVEPWGYQSLASRAGDLIYVSGLMAYDASRKDFVRRPSDLPNEGAELVRKLAILEGREGAAAAQAWIIYKQMEKVLAGVDSSLRSVMKINLYLRDITDLSVIERVAQTIFPQDPPALTVMQVDDLPLNDALMEMEVAALADR